MVEPTGYTALDLVGFTDKGTYSSSASYVKNDLVDYGGDKWQCLDDDVSNVTPTENAYWHKWIDKPDVSGKADISAIGTNETGATASKAYAVGEHFYKNGKFCTCIQAIAQGATFTLNTNYVEGTVAEAIYEEFVLLASKDLTANAGANTSVTDNNIGTIDLTSYKKVGLLLYSSTILSGGGQDNEFNYYDYREFDIRLLNAQTNRRTMYAQVSMIARDGSIRMAWIANNNNNVPNNMNSFNYLGVEVNNKSSNNQVLHFKVYGIK